MYEEKAFILNIRGKKVMNVIIKGKIVFIPIEVKNREYKAKLLLANYFLQAGYSVCIGSLWHMDEFMVNAEDSVYITKDFYKYRFSFLDSLHRNRNFVVGWDEEGLIYDIEEEYVETSLNENTLRAIDLIITWGKRQKNTIEKFLRNYTNQICALGNPRLDLLNFNIVTSAFSSEISYILKEFGSDYILVNSNFNIATRDDYDSKVAIISCNGESKRSIAFVERMNRLVNTLAPYFFSAIKTIATEFPEKKIVFRPHPAERLQDVEDIFKNYSNIYVVKKFSVNPWIACASLVIHSGCTTGMEAAIMGKMAISYQPNISLEYPITIPDQLSKVLNTEDELLSIISSMENKQSSVLNNEQKSILGNYVSFTNNETCSERIVKSIDKENKIGKFVFATPFLDIRKFVKTSPFNVEFGSLSFSEFKKDLLSLKRAMSLHYKEKILILTENVFFVVNKKSKIKYIYSFREIIYFAKRVVRKITRLTGCEFLFN